MITHKKPHFSITRLVLAVGLTIFSGCATAGNYQQQGNQNPELSQVRKPVLRHNPSYSKPEETVKEDRLPPASIEELEGLGDRYFASGNLHMAFVNYEKALQESPKNPTLLCKKGLLLSSAGLYEDAEKVFSQVLNDKPGYAPAHQGLGKTYFLMKRYDDAEPALQEAVALDPSLWDAYNMLGVIYDNRKMCEAALSQYRKSLSLRPDDGMLYHNLGVSLSLAGKWHEAVEAYKVALMKGYRESRTYNCLGLSLSKLGLYQEAFEAFKAGGGVASAHNNLGFVYLNEEKHDKALECFEKAISSSPQFYVKASENLKTVRALP